MQLERELLPPQPRYSLKQETTMSKPLSVPASRLICLGGAKLTTNAGERGNDETDELSGFGE